MGSNSFRRRRAWLALAALALAGTIVPAAARASGHRAMAFSDSKVGIPGGEPSIVVGPEGNIYVSSPGDPILARSTNGGRTWSTRTDAPFNSSNDTSINVDRTGAVYLSNLGPLLQGYVYKSTHHGNGPWQLGGGLAEQNDSSNMPLLVDRQWTDAYVPPGKSTNHARVYLTYHDWEPNQIWVNASTDGGRKFGPAQDVMASSPLAQADSFCNTIPGGLKVVQSGPHAGRVYVAWLAADVATSSATGCNDTEMDSFHSVWIAWSDNAAAAVPTWTAQLVYDGGPLHDAALIFADLALDSRGNPYVAFPYNLGNQWDVYVEASFDGGRTWDGPVQGGGLGGPGGPAGPIRIPAGKGTHIFPAITAGDPGKIDVAFLGTRARIPMLPSGKPKPGGDPKAKWRVYVAQSLDLRSKHPTWTVVAARPSPMHLGDICTLGLFCSVTGGDRKLLDFIDVAADARGMAHVAFTATTGAVGTWVANQTSGPGI